ncbi:piggyBac transposable element-derived protein 4-like [Centroberyx affinis]|uniref:piggyBac transposable element-derived protein 4-like n=1 Tax=Centroberyx affinis TaxID=166261 RepID=UPI003A5C2A89
MKRHLAQEALERIAQSADSEQRSVSDSDEEASKTEDDDNTDDEVSNLVPPIGSDSSDDSAGSGEETEETAGPSNEWKSKNGQIVWSPTHAETLRYIPATGAVPGPTRYATTRISTVKSCFDLFMTEKIMQLLLDMTNLQGRRSLTDWKDIDATDLQAYVGLLILAGVYRSRDESTRSLWDGHTGRAVFRATMSHHTFSLISSNLRFDDKLTRPARHQKHDKLAAFRTIWEKWVHRLPLLFNPGQDVCVDEQLVPFKGRCGFRQFMPRKPAKYGIKIWVTCDVITSYAWKMQIYTGKPAGSPEVNQGQRVVLEMTEGLQGNTVTCDNFFTSYALAEELLRRKLALVGTIRKNGPELPPQLLQTRQRAPRSSRFAFTRTHTAVSYVPKRGKNVLLLSTKHREPAVSHTEHQKPTIITDYNRCKGSVDNLDKVVGAYSCRRRTCRWPLVLFYNMLDVSAYNAFVLWTAVDPSWNRAKTFKRRLFMEELGKMLVSPQMLRREHLPRTPAAAAMVAELQDPGDGPVPDSTDSTDSKRRRWCEFCTGRKKKTATTCIKCGKHTCKDHTSSYCSSCCT